MKKLMSLFVLLTTGCFSAWALAEEASVKFLSPANGAKLDSMAQNKASYEVVPGPKGDHVHFYIDGTEVAVLRQLKGSYTMETLGPGKHELCIKVVNKGHTPIGVQQCISVIAE
jgi:hypothetical protein